MIMSVVLRLWWPDLSGTDHDERAGVGGVKHGKLRNFRRGQSLESGAGRLVRIAWASVTSRANPSNFATVRMLPGQRLDQQLDQAVGDLAGARLTRRREQRQPAQAR